MKPPRGSCIKTVRLPYSPKHFVINHQGKKSYPEAGWKTAVKGFLALCDEAWLGKHVWLTTILLSGQEMWGQYLAEKKKKVPPEATNENKQQGNEYISLFMISS